MKKTCKSFKELSKLPTYKERFDYLKMTGEVGHDTFGSDRYINQAFYQTKEWKDFRDKIILRDDGCDLGLKDYPISKGINPKTKKRIGVIIHHINPITAEDIEERKKCVLDPNNAICCSLDTHNAIHYGSDSIVEAKIEVERKPGDTCPWKH